MKRKLPVGLVLVLVLAACVQPVIASPAAQAATSAPAVDATPSPTTAPTTDPSPTVTPSPSPAQPGILGYLPNTKALDVPVQIALVPATAALTPSSTPCGRGSTCTRTCTINADGNGG